MDIRAGDFIPKRRYRITQEKIKAYAEASGDFNPIHVDPSYASRTPFRGTIAHGLMAVGYLSQMMMHWVGNDWARNGTLSVAFLKPVRPDDEIIVSGRVISTEGHTVICEVSCDKDDGTGIIRGEAKLRLRSSWGGNADGTA